MNDREDRGEMQHRLRQHRVHIHTDFGTLSIGPDESTEIYESGDVATNINQHILMINGQAISDASQILGQCPCGNFLTKRTFRYCHVCQVVQCPRCARIDDKSGLWFCEACYKEVRRSRFWAGLRQLLIGAAGKKRL